MNLKLPAVAAIVAVAGGVAAVRAAHGSAPQHASPSAGFTVADTTTTPSRAPAVARTRADRAGIVVYVAGSVVRRGIYRLAPGARADDAVRAAGGPTSDADLVAINLAAPLADGDEVVVSQKGSADDAAAAPAPAIAAKHHKRKRRAKHHARKRRRHVPAANDANGLPEASGDELSDANADASDVPASPVDINAADASALEALPGIGTKLAERIVTFRELNGPFAAHDDLLDVGGMTQKRLDAIEPFLL